MKGKTLKNSLYANKGNIWKLMYTYEINFEKKSNSFSKDRFYGLEFR